MDPFSSHARFLLVLGVCGDLIPGAGYPNQQKNRRGKTMRYSPRRRTL
jgi:hypothetical protein